MPDHQHSNMGPAKGESVSGWSRFSPTANHRLPNSLLKKKVEDVLHNFP